MQMAAMAIPAQIEKLIVVDIATCLIINPAIPVY